MKIIRLLLLLQLSSMYLYKFVTANVPGSERIRKSVKLTELNDDVLILLFNNLNMTSLLNLAMASPKLSPIVEDHVRQKYKDIFVTIMDTTNPNRNQIDEPTDIKQIFVYSLHMTKTLLKYFGSVLKSLLISQNTINDANSTAISQEINKYCSKSLTRLHLGSIKEDTLQQFDTPFENVDQLWFDINKDRLKTNLSLPELFPNVKELQVNIWKNADVDFLNIQLPKLQSLHVGFPDQSSIFAKSFESIKILMRNNPQIESLDLFQYFSYFNVKKINELLPNLRFISF